MVFDKLKQLMGADKDPLDYQKGLISKEIARDNYTLKTPDASKLVLDFPRLGAIRGVFGGLTGGNHITYEELANAATGGGFDDTPDTFRKAKYGMITEDKKNAVTAQKAQGKLQDDDKRKVLYQHGLDAIVSRLLHPAVSALRNGNIEVSDRNDTVVEADNAGNYRVENFDLDISGIHYKFTLAGGPHPDRGSNYLHTVKVENVPMKKKIIDLKPEAMKHYEGQLLTEENLGMSAIIAKRKKFNEYMHELPDLVNGQRFDLYLDPAELTLELRGLGGHDYLLTCLVGAAGIDDFPDKVERDGAVYLDLDPNTVDNDQRLIWGPLYKTAVKEIVKQYIQPFSTCRDLPQSNEIEAGPPQIIEIVQELNLPHLPDPVEYQFTGTKNTTSGIEIGYGDDNFIDGNNFPWGSYRGQVLLPLKGIIGHRLNQIEL